MPKVLCIISIAC